MKIYTKTGDNGNTALLGGERVMKSNKRIEAYGTIDELNAHLGLLRDYGVPDKVRDRILQIQNELFNIGSYLACEVDPDKFRLIRITEQQIQRLEAEIDEMDSVLPRLKNFILPGGNIQVSQSHIARCICRRAERRVVALIRDIPLDLHVLKYLNRLSDYFFVLARYLGMANGAQELIWTTKFK